MDRETLKAILESVVDDMNTVGRGFVVVGGPQMRKNKDVMNVKIFFDVDKKFLVMAEGEKHFMEIHYKFNLEKDTDDYILENISSSIMDASSKLKEAMDRVYRFQDTKRTEYIR